MGFSQTDWRIIVEYRSGRRQSGSRPTEAEARTLFDRAKSGICPFSGFRIVFAALLPPIYNPDGKNGESWGKSIYHKKLS